MRTLLDTTLDSPLFRWLTLSPGTRPDQFALALIAVLAPLAYDTAWGTPGYLFRVFPVAFCGTAAGWTAMENLLLLRARHRSTCRALRECGAALLVAGIGLGYGGDALVLAAWATFGGLCATAGHGLPRSGHRGTNRPC